MLEQEGRPGGGGEVLDLGLSDGHHPLLAKLFPFSLSWFSLICISFLNEKRREPFRDRQETLFDS